MPPLSLADLGDPSKFGFPTGSPIYDLSLQVRQAIIEAHTRIQGPAVFGRFWERVLTAAERVQLGDDVEACYALNPLAVNHLCPLRDWTLEQAIIEVAHSIGFLTPQDRLWLLGCLGVDTSEANSTNSIPRWNRRTGQLIFRGELCRELNAGRATASAPILDEFQDSGWPEFIRNPVFTDLNPQAIHQTVRNLNKGLTGIVFSVQGNDIHWNPTAS